MISKGACPFEGCQYGQWVATEAVEVYPDVNSAPSSERLQPGTTITAITREIHSRPRKAIVTHTYRSDEQAGIRVGHNVYPLYPIGEGAVAVWHGGATKNTSLDLKYDYGQPGIQLDWVWWVQARLLDGRSVWLKSPRGFTASTDCSATQVGDAERVACAFVGKWDYQGDTWHCCLEVSPVAFPKLFRVADNDGWNGDGIGLLVQLVGEELRAKDPGPKAGVTDGTAILTVHADGKVTEMGSPLRRHKN